jgi:hypothetical protein
MARLPQIGGDRGEWGELLNEYLSVEHNSDGSLKKSSDIEDAKNDAAIAINVANEAIPQTHRGQANGVAELDGSGKLPLARIPSGVATLDTLANGGSAANLRTIYVTSTGGDDTIVLQAAIDQAHAVGGARIRLPRFLNLNSAPRTDRGGNAIVALPNYGAGASYIVFEGAPGGTLVSTTQTGLVYSSSYGPPSVIGGPTTEQLGANANYSASQIRMTDITIQTPTNPTISGLDLSRMANISIDRIIARGATFAVQPTHFTFGIRLPEGLNGARNFVGHIEAQNYYAGVLVNSAHVTAQLIFTYYCYIGLAVTGNTQVTANDGHSSWVGRLLTQESVYHIASFSPVSGAISLPSGKPVQLHISVWDIEDAPAGDGWAETVYHVLDDNHQLFGYTKYGRVIGNIGLTAGQLLVSGGLNLELHDLASRKRWFDIFLRSSSTTERWLKLGTPAAISGGIQWLTDDVLRWRFRKNTTAESGGGNGGDLALESYADDGVTKLFDHIVLLRKNGQTVWGGTHRFRRRTYSSTSLLSTNDHIVGATGYTAAITLTLPAASSHGGEIRIMDEGNGAGTYNITIVCGGTDKFTGGVATQKVISSNGGSVSLYSDGTSRWHSVGERGTITTT